MKAGDILDYQSPLEKGLGLLAAVPAVMGLLFLLLAAGNGLMAGFCWLDHQSARDYTHPIPRLLLCALITSALAFSLYILSTKVTVHYYFDHELQQLLLRRNLFGWETFSKVALFEDLHCVTVDGRYIQEKTDSHWVSALVLVTTRRQIIPVTDYSPADSWVPSSHGLAQRLGLPFVPNTNPDRLRLRVQAGRQGLKISHQSDYDSWLRHVVYLFVTTAAFMLLVISMTWMYMYIP